MVGPDTIIMGLKNISKELDRIRVNPDRFRVLAKMIQWNARTIHDMSNG